MYIVILLKYFAFILLLKYSLSNVTFVYGDLVTKIKGCGCLIVVVIEYEHLNSTKIRHLHLC